MGKFYKMTERKTKNPERVLNEIAVMASNAKSYRGAGVMITAMLLDYGLLERKPNNIGYNITRIMDEKGMTQTELAELTGMSRSSIADYASDKCSPLAENLGKIAVALEVPVDDLVFGSDRKMG